MPKHFALDTGGTLLDSLVAYWPLDEDSETRYDIISPGSGPAAQFVKANSEYLSISDNSDLSVGDIDFTFSCWVYLDTKAHDSTFFSKKDDDAAGQEEYLLRYRSSEDRFWFKAVTESPSIDMAVFANSFGSPAIDTWYFIVVRHDSTANTVNIQVNNGTVDSASTGTNVPFDGPSSFRIGAENSTVASLTDGRVSLLGFWKRLLTSDEVTRIYNSGKGTVYKNLIPSDKTSLITYWNLHEGSGTRYDSHGSNDLTDNNTVTQASGVDGGNSVGDNNTVTQAASGASIITKDAAQFTRTNSEFLSHPDNTDLSLGSDTAFTVACWVYLDSKPGFMGLVQKGGGVTNDSSEMEYSISYNSVSDRFTFFMGPTPSSSLDADNLGSPSTGTWYFIVAWHDPTADTVNIQINDGTVDSTARTAGSQDTTDRFTIGRASEFNGNYTDGRIEEVGFWKRVLTSQERTDLYNGGNGNTILEVSGEFLALFPA